MKKFEIVFAVHGIVFSLLILQFSGESRGQNDSYSGVLVSVDAVNESLTDVLKKLAVSAGKKIEIRSVRHDFSVTIKLHQVPLETAITKILGGKFNHAILYKNYGLNLVIYVNEIPKSRPNSPSEISSNSVIVGSNEPSVTPEVSISGAQTKFRQASRTVYNMQ